MRLVLYGLWLIAAGIITVMLMGCSSGNSLSGANNGGITKQFGMASVTSCDPLQPPVTSGGSSTEVTGIAGAKITRLLLTYPPTIPPNAEAVLKTTKIAFTRNGNIFLMNADGSDQAQLTSGATSFNPSWFPDGTKLAFTRFDSSVGANQIFTINVDGSGLRRVTDGTGFANDPAVSPDGTQIAFSQNFDKAPPNIYIIPANGGQATQVTSGGLGDFYPTWSPDGARLAFVRDEGVAIAPTQIYIVDTNGGNLHKLLVDTAPREDQFEPAWSPVGNTIAYRQDVGGRPDITLAEVQNVPTEGSRIIARGFSEPAWSPDGSRLAVAREDNTGESSSIWSIASVGGSPVQLTEEQALVRDTAPAWSPIISKRLIIGSHGLLGTSAAGFIFGQKGDVVTSFLVFNAASPTSARVLTTTGINPGLSSYLFSITADKLTALSYLNDLYSTPIVVIGSSAIPESSGALVSFNSQTGRVAVVIPYVTARAAAGFTANVSGNTTILQGTFTGVWDDNGINRAPRGATEVHLDAATGMLLSVK